MELNYGSVPFAPTVGLQPQPISIEQFVSWCPATKLEGLHQEQGIGGVGIIGSLVKDMPLNRWSQIHLVLWDVPKGAKIWQAWQIMPDDPQINLTEATWALPGEWQEIAERMQVLEGKGKPYGPRPQERWAFRWKAVE